MSNQEQKFPKGIIAFSPSDKAPSFVKAEIVMNVDEFSKWIKDNPDLIKTHAKYGRQLKFTLKESKDGKPYLEINNYVPKSNANNQTDELP